MVSEKITGFTLAALFKGGEEQATIALRGMYRGCLKRNLYHYNVLNCAVGHIDMEYMKMIFRNSGTMPSGPWRTINKQYNKTGKWGDVSVGNPSNGVITVTKPDNGNNGLYAVCTGEAKRGITPTSPFLASFCPMYNETNAFWEIKLTDTPENAARYARAKAQEYITEAESLLSSNNKITNQKTLDYLNELTEESVEYMRLGNDSLQLAEKQIGREALLRWSKAARMFTRAQVKSLMVRNMISPPPSSPEAFNL